MKKLHTLLFAVGIAATSFAQSFQSVKSIQPSAIYNNLEANFYSTGVELSWVASSELNMVRHDIERSTNGSVFQSVGYLAAGNSSTSYRYRFSDASPVTGINNYRIKTTDNRGNFTYSKIISINNNSFTRTEVKVIPNPVTDRMLNLQMNNLEEGKYNVVLYNTGGQQVLSQMIDIADGSITRRISLPANIARGQYFLFVSNRENQFKKSIVIQ